MLDCTRFVAHRVNQIAKKRKAFNYRRVFGLRDSRVRCHKTIPLPFQYKNNFKKIATVFFGYVNKSAGLQQESNCNRFNLQRLNPLNNDVRFFSQLTGFDDDLRFGQRRS